MGSAMDKMAGKTKKNIGKMTNNKQMQAEGMYQEGKAKLKQNINKQLD